MPMNVRNISGLKFEMAYTRAWPYWHCYLEKRKRMIMQNCVIDRTFLAKDCTKLNALLAGEHLKPAHGRLLLEDGTVFEGTSFGYEGASAGEVVFSTGMVGYPETLTDPSYAGQILTLTYPLTGNYGVPDPSIWENDNIHIAGLIISNYVDTPSHVQSTMSLGTWLIE